MILLIFNILMVLGYAVFSVSYTKDIPVSFSATYYTLGKYGWLFQLVMYSVGFSLMPLWISSTEYEWLAFLSCAGLLFVASTPFYRTSLQGQVHYSSAVLCCVCAVVWQILEGLWDVTLFWGFVGGMLALQWKDKYMWWIECAVIGSLFSNLIRLM